MVDWGSVPDMRAPDMDRFSIDLRPPAGPVDTVFPTGDRLGRVAGSARRDDVDPIADESGAGDQRPIVNIDWQLPIAPFRVIIVDQEPAGLRQRPIVR